MKNKKIKIFNKGPFLKAVRRCISFQKREDIKEWSKAIYNRDKGRCQICLFFGRDKILGKHFQPHHIIPRTVDFTKHDINNGILLCYFHHEHSMFSPNNSIWFSEWLKTNKSEQYSYLINTFYFNSLFREKISFYNYFIFFVFFSEF